MTTTIADIFKSLEATTKRNEKLAILSSNIDNVLLQDILVAALDPYTQYYIKNIPAYVCERSDDHGEVDLRYFLGCIENLSSRKITGNAALNYLVEILSHLEPADAIIAERIIKKDLRCGVQASTVNKVWTDLIPTYPCLLGKAYDEKSIKAIQWPAYSQLKADGMRVNVIWQDGNITVRGRSGKPVELLGHLDADFEKLGKTLGRDCVFDGELIVLDKDGNVSPRRIGNGMLNKAVRGTISNAEAKLVRVRLWDIISLDDFKQYKSDVPYQQRFQDLIDCVDKTATSLTQPPVYSIIESKVVYSLSEAMLHFEHALSEGEEGTMLKNMNGLWEDKRSNDLVKMKAEEEADLEIVGWNSGTIGTKNEGKLGSLICATADRQLEVGISGFTDELRENIFNNINQWMGRVVTVRYNEIINHQSKPVKSLFLPRFVELREDKFDANLLSELR